MDNHARLKQLAKECCARAVERLEGAGAEAELSDATLLSLFASESIDALLNAGDDMLRDDDAVRDLKRLRKLLRRTALSHLDVKRHDTTTHEPEPQVELGQYAGTAVATLGDDRRVDRFARLMGGAKSSTGAKNTVTHATHAASAVDTLSRQSALLHQFEDAASRRGKLKGLGK